MLCHFFSHPVCQSFVIQLLPSRGLDTSLSLRSQGSDLKEILALLPQMVRPVFVGPEGKSRHGCGFHTDNVELLSEKRLNVWEQVAKPNFCYAQQSWSMCKRTMHVLRQFCQTGFPQDELITSSGRFDKIPRPNLFLSSEHFCCSKIHLNHAVCV